jgi:hypothetical protein
VFDKQGKFQKEMIIAKETKGATVAVGQAPGIQLNSSGSVWDIAFERCGAAELSRGRRPQQPDPHSAARHAGGSRIDWRRRPSDGPLLRPGQRGGRSRGVLYTGEQHVTKRAEVRAEAARRRAAARGQ